MFESCVNVREEIFYLFALFLLYLGHPFIAIFGKEILNSELPQHSLTRILRRDFPYCWAIKLMNS